MAPVISITTLIPLSPILQLPAMGSSPRRLNNFPARKSTRRSTSSHCRRSRPHHNKSTITTTSSSSSVSDKLAALKNLLPAQEIDGAAPATTGSADQLFQETADYILLLRTQVSVLQKLVDLYGSSSSSSLVQQ